MLSDSAVARLRGIGGWPEMPDARYSIVQEIGRGGMGTVYLARDEELGREVAIKVPNGLAGAGLEHRLRGEARVLARLEHPGIVPIHDVGRLADGRLFHVMKRVRGRTLQEYLAEHTELAERLRIFERICEPVAFAHAAGVLHRDLKPDNVMIGAFGEVMVMDWGVAKHLAETDAPQVDDRQETGSGTAAGTVIGTRGYMAPEQARGDSHSADRRSDVYSLGALLFLLLAGESPGGPAVPDRAIWRRADVPRPLRAICARALQEDPRERYESVEALAGDVARFRAGHAVAAYAENLFERLIRLGRTYRVAILLVLAYIVMRAMVALLAGR